MLELNYKINIKKPEIDIATAMNRSIMCLLEYETEL